MADKLKKAKVTLGRVPLAATSGISWKFIGGVRPYQTTLTVHESEWKALERQVGEPLILEIIDSRGVKTEIHQVYILHKAPSDSRFRVSFVVSDKRWFWANKLIVRDFNMPRKTGDRTAYQPRPVETQAVVDEYDYLAYSLHADNTKWTAQQAIEEVLTALEDMSEGAVGVGGPRGGFRVESFPLKDWGGGLGGPGSSAQFTLQGITLRDQGDLALARLLAYVPGADVYINAQGQAVVYDATDIQATSEHFDTIPVSTRAGEVAAWVDRKAVRPSKVFVYYQREIEVMLEYEDDYREVTSAQQVRNAPYIENVCPTVDPRTRIEGELDPETGRVDSKTVDPGTWVQFDKLLAAWDRTKPVGSWPWNFDTISKLWLKGDLEGALGCKGQDVDENANTAMRVMAIRQHFRQSFRINRRYMSRIRSLRAVRVGLLDPVTGARAPAAVWGQACITPNTKSKMIASRGTDETSKLKVYRNVDYLAESRKPGVEVIQTSPGPTRVNIVDEELGIFRLEWIASPYGDTGSFLPSKVICDAKEAGCVPTRDLSKQDTDPMGAGIQVEEGSNGIFLSPRLEYAVIVTMVPSAPNNEKQFHREEVEADDVRWLFKHEFGIAGGEGPELHVAVPPGEVTARFALANQSAARPALAELFGLDGEPHNAGIAGPAISGYQLTNGEREIKPHATSYAAELLTSFADNVQGAVVTRVPDGGLKLVGNMSGATVRVAGAPSAKVDAVHQFPGQQRPISRLALMPESARQLILGTLPFRD